MDNIAGGSALTEKFCYDALNRLTDYSTSATSCSVSGSKHIDYSQTGNITYKSDVGSYTYPAGGGGPGSRPHAVQTVTLSDMTVLSYTYDDNGNMVTGGARSSTWTSFDKVSSITRATNTVCFAYDSGHERIKMEERAGTDCSATLSQTTWYVNGPGVRAEKVVAGQRPPRRWGRRLRIRLRIGWLWRTRGSCLRRGFQRGRPRGFSGAGRHSIPHRRRQVRKRRNHRIVCVSRFQRCGKCRREK